MKEMENRIGCLFDPGQQNNLSKKPMLKLRPKEFSHRESSVSTLQAEARRTANAPGAANN